MGALIIGLIHLILGLIMGLLFTIGAVALEEVDIEGMDNVVKISEGQVHSFFNLKETELKMEETSELLAVPVHRVEQRGHPL